MKWMHIADLHIGKTHEAAELERDQKAVLDEIIEKVREEKPDGMFIAGDVYDRSMPSETAVVMFDRFLTELSSLCPVYMISGNHDSGGRLSFAGNLLSKQNVFVSGGYTGEIYPIVQGDTDIYLLPYVHAEDIKKALRDRGCSKADEITDTDSAVRAAIGSCKPGNGKYRVLIAHLFVTNGGKEPLSSDSETKHIRRDPVGGLDSVDVSAFEGFDYVALGHIHAPQCAGRETVRYAGTPMMYSFSEEHQIKSISVFEPESDTPVRTIPLTAGRRMRIVRGLLNDLLTPGFDPLPHDDIVLAELTDTTEQPGALARLRNVYPTVQIKPVGIVLDEASESENIDARFDDPLLLIEEFFRKRRQGMEMTDAERAEISALLDEADKGVTA